MAGKRIGNKDGIIKKSHLYYYQIQQQAIVAVRNWCDFVVRGEQQGIVSATGTFYYGIVE